MDQLIDLGGRNNLLYYRDLKQGTLDLQGANQSAVDDLLQNRVVRLSKLFPTDEQRVDAIRRVRNIRNKAQENFEERGLQTLYIACGMARWDNQRGSAKPNAPVLLRSAAILSQGAAQDDFSIALTGEMELNPTLLHLLATEFNVTCDWTELEAQIDGVIDEQWEIDRTYDWLQGCAGSVTGFEISPRTVLGNFAYAKLPMVNDLENSTEELVAHDLIAAIAGDEEARETIRAASASPTIVGPDHVPLADEFLVLDADSSQNYAINAAVAGANLIVRGPPGTGKSQTITNLIATLVARGQKVLFVAEKRAAIDAVLKRLQTEGLEDLVLDLHGAAPSRRRLLAQSIGSALRSTGQTPVAEHGATQKVVEARRETLNRHNEALHAKREPWGISVYEAQDRVLGVLGSSQTDIRFPIQILRKLDGQTIEQLRDQLSDYAGLGGLTLGTSDSPWAKATITSADEARAALETISGLRARLRDGLRLLRPAGLETKAGEPETLSEWADLLELWRQIANRLSHFKPEIYKVDLNSVCATLERANRGPIARLRAELSSREFRSARRTIRTQMLPNVRLSLDGVLDDCESARKELEWWQGINQETDPSSPTNLSDLESIFRQLMIELKEVERVVNKRDLSAVTTVALEKLLDGLIQDQTTLTRLPEMFRLATALTAAGVSELLDEMRQRQFTRDLALQCLSYAWCRSILDNVALEDAAVGAFDADHHSAIVEEYRSGDREHILTTAARVRRICAERATAARDEYKEEAALLQREAARRRGHLPVRQLFESTSHVLLELKPCWVMSPLVVSQILPAHRYFDVVVFDEASQVPPADAVPAILRGNRLVVAGDERQLPPTTFFASQTAEDEDNDATDVEGGATLVGGTSGMESILQSLESLLPAKTLEWHYRSLDERLIAFSNSYIYDRMLTTFPGTASEDSPICHVLVPWTPGHPGEDQSATAEVQRVVELILEHAASRPKESLGVIAMGIKHANRIDEGLRRALRDHPELADFFDETKSLEERFFVKNLERVQGDERDAIILSIGYAKNELGKLLYRFGPLLMEGGDRRLNVAVTRARKRMTLVSSFDYTDMDPDRSSAEGVRLLRLYLQYAASRGSNLGEAALQLPALNAFEVSVRDTLTRAGIPLVAQYGCSGYRIDFVAKHPTQEGRMILAIECDGATYHSSQSARDRDRLRQAMLEARGWVFHRIWSSEWFHRRDKAVEKAVKAYKDAVSRSDLEDARPDHPSNQSSNQNGPRRVDVVTQSPQAGQRPVRVGAMPARPGYSISFYSHWQLVQVVKWVESDGLLRTEDELIVAVMEALDMRRRGSRIVEALTRAIRSARAR